MVTNHYRHIVFIILATLMMVVAQVINSKPTKIEILDDAFGRQDRSDFRPLQFGKRQEKNFRPLQFGKKSVYRPLQFGKRSFSPIGYDESNNDDYTFFIPITDY
uniref:Neuropeptide-Like Protein n=1 Tax=Strongyloides venezuelensis TaxID=75913 RepID=A0A0K0F877_STRVS